MSNTIKNLKSGNYEVVDNQGVSVTTHFIECLEKEFADLEAKLAEYQNDRVGDVIINAGKKIKELQQQLADNNEFFNAFNCKNFNEFKDFISTFMLTPHEEQTLIRELKQQLAEKEKEETKRMEDFEKWCQEYYKSNQTAIAELEKVKDIILNERKITSFKFDTFNKGKDTALFWLNEQIDQQINELKGEK